MPTEDYPGLDGWMAALEATQALADAGEPATAYVLARSVTAATEFVEGVQPSMDGITAETFTAIARRAVELSSDDPERIATASLRATMSRYVGVGNPADPAG